MIIVNMNTTFSNQQVNITGLPSAAGVNFQPLHNKYTWVVVISTLIGLFIIVALGASVFYLSLPEEHALLVEYRNAVFAVSLVLSAFLLVLNIAGVRKKGYAVREHDIIYKSGLLNQKQTTVPFNRVQHVEIYEGALLRLFGLCRIEFFTAGGSFGDLKIPGLTLDEANKIKTYVIEQVVPQIAESTESDTANVLNPQDE